LQFFISIVRAIPSATCCYAEATIPALKVFAIKVAFREADCYSSFK
jgi:hypothetical protein